MGHDISPIGNHQLNTNDIKALAQDICSRVDMNIVYGYWGKEEHFKLLGENRNDEEVVLGKIIKDETFKTYWLTDDYYQLKQLHQKFGDDILYKPEYWGNYYKGKLPDDNIIAQERKKLVIPDFCLNFIHDDETEYLNISKELYVNDIPYYCRWWSFCRLFTEGYIDNPVYLANLLEFRKELMHFTLAFGGDKIYYLDDQSDVLQGVGQGAELELSWKEFEQFVTDKTKLLMLDIPKFLTDKTYRNEFLELKEYPLSFIDDFSDIK